MSYLKGVRTGAEGNNTLLKSYGGGSSAPRQGYATGGSVGSLNKDGPALSEGLAASGAPAKRSLARPGRKIGKGAGKKKDAKTNINVIVAPSAPKEAGPGPMPPMAGPPPGGPPMPPPGAGPGGPPMPMRASGGRVSDCKGLTKLKIGSKVKKRADGGSTISEDSRREASRLRKDDSDLSVWPLAKDAMIAGIGSMIHGASKKLPGRALGRAFQGLGAAGGALDVGMGTKGFLDKRSEARRIERGEAEPGKEDRKHGGKVCRAEGGSVGGLSNKDGGAGGGLGRLAKVKDYGK